MHPLHEYIANQVAEKLRSRKVLIWYDSRQEFAPFVAEIRGVAPDPAASVPVLVAGLSTQLAEYKGSFFEIRTIVEKYVSGDLPETVLVYLPGCERDRGASVLMELEKAGEFYAPQLKGLARNLLRQRYTDGVIDDILAPEVTYDDLMRAASVSSSAEPPSILRTIFHEASGNDALLAAWLSSDTFDGDVERKQAKPELAKLLRSRLGFELPEDAGLPKLRSIVVRYVLAGEFRLDLNAAPPASLDSIPRPKTKDDEKAVREMAKKLRNDFGDAYVELADQVETELGLRNLPISAESLGSVDTFRFEERAVLEYCGELIASQKFLDASHLVEQRQQSFWLDRAVERKAQWEACRRMAELGTATADVRTAVTKASKDPKIWIDSYTAQGGWHLVDRAQRRLETWVSNLDQEPEERPLGVVRRAYEDTCNVMALGFSNALINAKWLVSTTMPQTHIYSDIVAKRPKPTAYFLVDAMRFEMGAELPERLPSTADLSLRFALGAIPTITPIGMAALQPGASSNFNVVDQAGKLGARIEDTFLPDLAARRKFAAAHVPGLVDMALDELLGLQRSKLAKKVEGATVVVIRSQEIDNAGEAGFIFQARRVMDTVIDNIARAIRKLATVGVEYSVVTADHGHLFFSTDRDESMRIESPGGDEVDLHRRCWIGRGGATPPGCIRVAASALGYASDLDFVFPMGCGIFKAGGDLAYHHGGLSLQELIVPIVTIRLKVRDTPKSTPTQVTAEGLPDAVTNRIFSVTLLLGGHNLPLFSNSLVVRPLLMSAGKQVGAVGMAIGAELDRATGSVELQAGKPVTVAFLVSDESVPYVRVLVQDPATDAELYRSPNEIPVRFGV